MAKVILESTDTSAYVAASDVTIYGSGSSTDKVQVLDGIKITTDASVERVEFARASTAYTYKVIGGGIEVLYNGVKVADVAPTKLAFTDGSATVVSTFNPTTFATDYTLGGKTVTATATTVVPTLATGTGETSTINTSSGSTIQVAVSANGTSDASNGNKVYTIATGNYTYNISGFGASDVLNFPSASTASVTNTSNNDGLVDLTWSSGSNTMLVHLIGISATNDAQLNSATDFNSVFGAGTITIPTGSITVTW